MKERYAISLIVPVYNAERYVGKCVRSLMEQSLENIEFIFIDDNTPDGSFEVITEIVEQYPNRIQHIRLLRHSSRRGASASRNTGIEQAKGKYLSFCDADDWIDKDGIKSMVEVALSHDADIVYTDFFYTFPDKEVVKRQQIDENPKLCIRAMLTEKMHGSLCNKAYKKSLFSEHSIVFNEKADLWEDLYANVQLFYFSNKIVYLPKAFYHYVQYKSDSLSSVKNDKRLKGIFMNTSFIIDFLEKHGDTDTYKNEIQILKLAAKQTLLFTLDLNNFKKWQAIYPESNADILSFSALPLHLRIVGWFSAQEIWPVVKFWLLLKGMKKN